MTTLSPPLSPQNSHPSRPRPITQASHRSQKSWRSSSSGNKVDLTETDRDKRRLQAKSDPTQALREAQPAAIALEDSNLENLRAAQHKDSDGKVITDPDRSNPTRHRLERPLDTIRAFNAAAEGTSHRRSSYNQRPSPNLQQGSSFNDGRRSSYYGNNGNGPAQSRPRPGQGGYYKNGSYGVRPDQYQEDMYQQNIPYGRPPRQQPQQYEDSQGSNNSYGHSYETMTSASDDYGKSTNPSSQNSSFDRLHQIQRKPDEYGYHEGDMGPPTPQSMNQNQNPYSQQNGYYNQQSQQPLQHSQQSPQQYQQQYQQQYSQPNESVAPPPANNPRQPIRLNSGYNQSRPAQRSEKPLPPPKRQSWIKRTFSRRDT